jgi:hypothetical protein
MRSGWVALVGCCALLYGCATPWPQGVVAVADPAFAHRSKPITTVDILPVDLQLWEDDPSRGEPDQLREAAESTLTWAATSALLQRGYEVRAVIDWQGDYDAPTGGRALAYTPDAIAATIDSLAGYGAAAARQGGLPVPYLPAHLGDNTHSDATLYIGGWSFVGDTDTSGETVAEYIVIGIIIVAVVVIAIAAAKGSGSGGGGHGGGGGGGGVHASAGAAHVAGTGIHAGVSAGRVSIGGASAVHASAVHASAGYHGPSGPRVIEGVARTLDAFGRIATATEERPDWYEGAPHDGHSAMYVEMTLVDNHTGLVLWHARQQFPATAAQPDEVKRVIASLIATLPAAP